MPLPIWSAAALLLTVALLSSATAAQPPPVGAPVEPTADGFRAEAQRWRAIFEVERLAGSLEELARRFPKEEDAPLALREATALRLVLHQGDQAVADAALFVRLYGRRQLRAATTLQLEVAETLARRGDWKPVRALAQGLLGRRDQSFAEQLAAEGLLARAHEGLGDARRAASRWAAIETASADDEALAKRLAAAGSAGEPEEAADLRRLGRALEVVGESRYRVAASAREQMRKATPPRYRGPESPKAIAAFMSSEVAPWLRSRLQKLQEAERAYLRVVQIRPLPPPRWVIAAAARVGDMWWELYQELRKPPWPHALQGDLRAVYESQLSHSLDPWGERARSAFETCVAYGARYQTANDDTRRCEARLTEHDPQRHPTQEALAPAAHWASTAVSPEPMPDPRPEGDLKAERKPSTGARAEPPRR